MKQIIKSLLDNDLYKFTMLQAFYNYEKRTEGKYAFQCRTPYTHFNECIDKIDEQLTLLCNLTFTSEELTYLNSLPFIKPHFIKFLKNFKLDRKYVNLSLDKKGHLEVKIKGPIIHTSMFEVPLLSIINEVYFSTKISKEKSWTCGKDRLKEKILFLKSLNKNILFSDFGTRRRFSFNWHENVIKEIIESKCPGFTGTSNVYFAKKFNLKPIGTMAHEWIMAHAGISSLEESTNLALSRWLEFYNSELGIALTDTYTTDYFLSEFKEKLSNSYFGVRHDSGDWKIWGYKIIKHYESLKIDPLSKTFVFSDGLDFTTIEKIYDEFHTKVKLLFGIGTNLTNDIGIAPLQIVIKMIKSDGKPVIKVSDTPNKMICADNQYKLNVINFLRNYKEEH